MSLASTILLALLAFPGAGQGETPLILDFNATWCGPCREMRPVVEKLQQRNYPIKSIDIDENRDLAKRYKITGVPTFVVVTPDGRELARSSGVQAATELAGLFNDAVTNMGGTTTLASASLDREQPASRVEDALASGDAGLTPKPWETVVRIKVHGQGAIGFGSGTVIKSTPEESIILTCAHIFQIEGLKKQPTPAQFNRKIEVDLFDGVLHGQHPKYVHPIETVEGEALDYEFNSDVGLIRIRPGRVLASSPVVPVDWKPSPGMPMTTVGCSEGNNASPWSTIITNPTFQGLVGKRRYEAIECQHAPRQGRSGGGLYTIEGYVAGVCNFAEPRGGHGLYASPTSIYKVLDRNQLSVCYTNPAARDQGTLVASRTRATTTPSRNGSTTVRAQNSSLPGSRAYPIPGPEQVGVTLPPLTDDSSVASLASDNSRQRTSASGWQAPQTTRRRPPIEDSYAEETEPATALPTDLTMDPAVAGGGGSSSMNSLREEEAAPMPLKSSGSSWRSPGSR